MGTDRKMKINISMVMKTNYFLSLFFAGITGIGLFCGLIANEAAAQSSDDPMRIIAFGAHPDDCEVAAGGVGALFAEEGHAFKCVSMTNGDIGHFGMSGGELALRRMDEVEEAADVLGIAETEVLDIHDGELMPTLENRRTVARKIREWQADIVMVHRRYDYHPDHRYAGVLVDDAMVLVLAKFFTPDTEPLSSPPVQLYYSDGFEKPYPFDPALVVSIDETADKKYDALAQMPSQFSDKQSWTYGTRDPEDVPEDEATRMKMRVSDFREGDRSIADSYRDQLIELYGQERGSEVEYAEAFQLGEYGRQVSVEELKALFPTFD